MNYTYDDFTSAAKKAGLLNQFSATDLQTAKSNPEFGLSMLSLMQDSANATTGEQKLLAQEATNQLRKSYSSGTQSSGGSTAYSGYGSQIDGLMNKISNYGSFNYSNEDSYNKLLQQVANPESYSYGNQAAYDKALQAVTNPGTYTYGNQAALDKLLQQVTNPEAYSYGDQAAIDKLLQQVTNPEAFTYNPANDPVYSSYKKSYLREGERAAADTLAKASAATGGIPSSYAVSAAQQAANNYTAGLADIIPTLYQDAYSRYLNDQSLKQSGLSALQNDKSTDYQAYLNNQSLIQSGLKALQSDKAADYQTFLDTYAMQQSSLDALESDRNFSYQNYLNEQSQIQNGLTALQSDRNFQYQDWQNGLSLLQTALGNYQTQDATGYARHQDAQNSALNAQNTAYSRYLNALDQLNNSKASSEEKAYASAQALANIGDFSALGKYYGWSDQQIANANANFTNKENAAMQETAAQIMAEAGDYTRLAAQLGLSDAEAKKLSALSAGSTGSTGNKGGTVNNSGVTSGNNTGSVDSDAGKTPDFSGKADNKGVNDSYILAMQADLRVEQDGKWGPKTREAAYKKYGTTDPVAAWNDNADRLAPTPKSYEEMVQWVNQAQKQNYDKNAVNAMIEGYKKQGLITPVQASALWQHYNY